MNLITLVSKIYFCCCKTFIFSTQTVKIHQHTSRIKSQKKVEGMYKTSLNKLVG